MSSLNHIKYASEFFFFFLFLSFLNWLYAISQRGERHLETPVAGSRCVSSLSLLSNLRLFTKDFIRHWFCGDDWLQFFHLAVFLTLGLLPLTPFLFCFFLYSVFHHCLFFFFEMESTLQCSSTAVTALRSRFAGYLHLNMLLSVTNRLIYLRSAPCGWFNCTLKPLTAPPLIFETAALTLTTLMEWAVLTLSPSEWSPKDVMTVRKEKTTRVVEGKPCESGKVLENVLLQMNYLPHSNKTNDVLCLY